MASVRLVLGAGEYDRVIEDADELLQQYRRDTGCYYLDYQPITRTYFKNTNRTKIAA